MAAIKALAAGGVISAVVATSLAPAGAASSVPFSDPNQTGSLTLCDRQGHALTSGSLDSIPFAWTAISSSPPPGGYRVAWLAVYQPIQYVDPGNWSGYQLTTNSIFKNLQHPSVQATNGDAPLLWADQAYPPHWQGLMEVRMLFGSPGKPVWNRTYPAAVVQVEGNNWHLVSPPGGTSCQAGSAVSEAALRDPSLLSGPPPSLIVGPGSGPGGGVSSQPHPPAAVVPSTRPGSAPTTTVTTVGDPSRDASSPAVRRTDGHGSDWAWVAGGGVATLLAAGGLTLWLRRRRAANAAVVEAQ